MDFVSVVKDAFGRTRLLRGICGGGVGVFVLRWIFGGNGVCVFCIVDLITD